MRSDKSGLLLCIVSAFFLSSCTVLEPGQVGVKVKSRGANAGLEKARLVQNEVWINPFSEKLYTYPTTIQSYVWSASVTEGNSVDESMSFNEKGGSVISHDVGITYRITDPLALAKAFNKDDETVVKQNLRISVRDQLSTIASRYSVYEILGNKRREILELVKSEVNNEFVSKGLTIDTIALVNKPRLPEAVQNSIDAAQIAISATEKAKAEVAQATAELKVSKIRALQSQVEAKQLTPLLLQKDAINKWDGKLPQYTGNNIPFITAPTTTK